MPPSTRGSAAFSARIACPASLVIAANRSHSGSSSRVPVRLVVRLVPDLHRLDHAAPPPRNRIDRARPRRPLGAAADVDLRLRVLEDREAGAPQHRLGGGGVRRPPVGRVAGVAVLDEVQLRIAGPVELRLLEEVVVLGDRLDLGRAALHALEDQQVARDVLVDQVERQQRMAQVVEHAEEQARRRSARRARRRRRPRACGTRCPARSPRRRSAPAPDSGRRSRPRRTRVGAAPLHLDRVEAGVAADVEHGPAAEVGRHRMGEAPPLHRRIVVQEVVRARSRTPFRSRLWNHWPKRADARADLRLGVGHRTTSLTAWTRKPQSPATTTLIDAGPISSRSSAASGAPSTQTSAARIGSAWADRGEPLPGVAVAHRLEPAGHARLQLAERLAAGRPPSRPVGVPGRPGRIAAELVPGPAAPLAVVELVRAPAPPAPPPRPPRRSARRSRAPARAGSRRPRRGPPAPAARPAAPPARAREPRASRPASGRRASAASASCSAWRTRKTVVAFTRGGRASARRRR